MNILVAFFAAGAVISGASAIALAFPGGPLEPMWRLNPEARISFAAMGPWAIVLMIAVCGACLAAAIGLWTLAPWGYRLATAILGVNAIGDAANAVVRRDYRTLLGVPIAAGMIWYLVRVRRGAARSADRG